MGYRASRFGRRPTAKPFGLTHTAQVHVPAAIEHLVGYPDAALRAVLRVDPRENVIVGAQNICHYMGIGSIGTLWRYVELYGFPAIKRPDGLWMTSMTAIDQWIFIAAEIVGEKLITSRGQNVTLDKAIARLEAQRDNPGKFDHKRRAAAVRVARGVGLAPGRSNPKVGYSGSKLTRDVRGIIGGLTPRESAEAMRLLHEYGPPPQAGVREGHEDGEG